MHTREITLRYGCSPVNLLYSFRTPFPKNSSGWLLPDIGLCHSSVQFLKVGNIRKSYGLSFNSWDYSLLSEHEISSYWLSLLIIHQWPGFHKPKKFPLLLDLLRGRKVVFRDLFSLLLSLCSLRFHFLCWNRIQLSSFVSFLSLYLNCSCLLLDFIYVARQIVKVIFKH